MPEDLALHDRLTGQEYLTLVGRMYGLERATITKRGNEFLRWMDLHGEPRKLIVDYSHGMKKKLALAAALIHDPQLLFLDEPFEGIDVIASRQIRELLSSLLECGVTIFLTSHVLEIVEKLCTSTRDTTGHPAHAPRSSRPRPSPFRASQRLDCGPRPLQAAISAPA